MALPKKKIFMFFFFGDEMLQVGAAVPLFQNNFKTTGKSSLTSFCAESNGKKKIGWCTIFHELIKKVLRKRRSLGIIRRFLKEELQSNQVKIPFPIHELII